MSAGVNESRLMQSYRGGEAIYKDSRRRINDRFFHANLGGFGWDSCPKEHRRMRGF
jgi:hypothetical protein